MGKVIILEPVNEGQGRGQDNHQGRDQVPQGGNQGNLQDGNQANGEGGNQDIDEGNNQDIDEGRNQDHDEGDAAPPPRQPQPPRCRLHPYLDLCFADITNTLSRFTVKNVGDQDEPKLEVAANEGFRPPRLSKAQADWAVFMVCKQATNNACVEVCDFCIQVVLHTFWQSTTVVCSIMH